MSAVHQTEDLLYSILLQVVVMIGAARVGHTLLRRLGQPGVGEIIAGLTLAAPSPASWQSRPPH